MRNYVLILLLFAHLIVHAQTETSMTLKECEQTFLANNLNL